MPSTTPLLIIVSSPSGAGKTTLCRKLLAEFGDLRFSVSHTTRAARPGEVDGSDYHFIDEATFDKMVDDEMFIEWAHVHGNRYGTSHGEIRAAAAESKDLVFDVDYQGARQIKEQYPAAVGIFVLPPSIEELRRRLWSRGTDAEDALRRRFQAALDEIAQQGDRARRAAPPRAQHPPGREAAQRLNAASKRSHSEAAGAADTAWQTQPPFSGPVSPPSG
jgi:guanylate kinase